MIVWDVTTARQAVTVPHPHPNGVLCMDMSRDGTLIVTVSKPLEAGDAQDISLWDVSSPPSAKRLISVPVPAGDPQVSCPALLIRRLLTEAETLRAGA